MFFSFLWEEEANEENVIDDEMHRDAIYDLSLSHTRPELSPFQG
jgi:hypothetical protein